MHLLSQWKTSIWSLSLSSSLFSSRNSSPSNLALLFIHYQSSSPQYIFKPSRPPRSKFYPSKMTRPAKTAPRVSVTQSPPISRRGRISKTKTWDMIKRITTSSRRIRKTTPSLKRSLSSLSPRSSHTSLSSMSHASILSSTHSTHSRHINSNALNHFMTIF